MYLVFTDDFYQNRLELDLGALNKTIVIIGLHNNVVI